MGFREQVQKDVDRTSLTKEQKPLVVEKICTVLDNNPELHYYQGFHDVAAISSSEQDLEELSLQCLRDFMTPTIEPTLKILNLLPELISTADTQLDAVMRKAPEPHFALAPLLTLFAHDSSDKQVLETVQLKVHQYGLGYILYLYSAVVMYRRDEILELTDGEPPEIVHSVLSRKGGSLDNIENDILFKAVDNLRIRIPLTRLRAYRSLSSHSVLKTGPHVSLDHARYCLHEISRPPVSARRRFAIAAAVVIVGILLQRSRRL